MTQAAQRKVRFGVIGLGIRGMGLLRQLLQMPDVDVPAVFDVSEVRCREGMALIQKNTGGRTVDSYSDYHSLLERDDLDAVMIAVSWRHHTEIAVAAMRAGKWAALEVGGASSVEECWELVRASEATGMHCMMLENCTYGRTEMAVLHMVRLGVFGEVVHCQCGYFHDWRKQMTSVGEKRHYVDHYLKRNANVYPSHGLGPISKMLGIHNGNRFLSLTSISSKARGVNEWAREHLGSEHPAATARYAMGDVITTALKCANGETVVLTLNSTLPRPYSRGGVVQGTRGIWMEDNASIYLEGRSPEQAWEPFANYVHEYEHPLWKRYIREGVKGGHNGMDYLVLRAFIDSVQNQSPPPIDVYDTAAWRAVTALSEQSISCNGASVSFPDFTSGKWINRMPAPASLYALDTIHFVQEEAING